MINVLVSVLTLQIIPPLFGIYDLLSNKMDVIKSGLPAVLLAFMILIVPMIIMRKTIMTSILVLLILVLDFIMASPQT